jgi:polyribonucleotide nucleotidyltransferase
MTINAVGKEKASFQVDYNSIKISLMTRKKENKEKKLRTITCFQQACSVKTTTKCTVNTTIDYQLFIKIKDR